MHPDIPDKFNVIQIHQPVRIVHHQGNGMLLFRSFPLRRRGPCRIPEIDKAAHLSLEALAVMLYGLSGHHGAQIASARRISDHARAASYEGNGLIARHLQPLHQTEGHEMPHVQAVRGGIEPDIKGGLPVIDQLLDLFLVGELRQQPPCLQLVKYRHFILPCLSAILIIIIFNIFFSILFLQITCLTLASP